MPQVLQSTRRVQTFGNARRLQNVLTRSNPLYGGGHLSRQLGTDIGQSGPDDLDLARELWMVDPVVETAPLEGVVQFAGSVGGEHHHRRDCRSYLPILRNRDGEGGQHLEQKRLELIVGAVDLIDQQYGVRRPQGLQDRTLEQEPLVEQRFL